MIANYFQLIDSLEDFEHFLANEKKIELNSNESEIMYFGCHRNRLEIKATKFCFDWFIKFYRSQIFWIIEQSSEEMLERISDEENSICKWKRLRGKSHKLNFRFALKFNFSAKRRRNANVHEEATKEWKKNTNNFNRNYREE